MSPFFRSTTLPSSILVPANDQFSQVNRQRELVILSNMESLRMKWHNSGLQVTEFSREFHHAKEVSCQVAHINEEDVSRVWKIRRYWRENNATFTEYFYWALFVLVLNSILDFFPAPFQEISTSLFPLLHLPKKMLNYTGLNGTQLRLKICNLYRESKAS